MSRSVLQAIIIVGAILLQLLVAPNIAIAGATPNFLLIAVVVIAISSGPQQGSIAGFGLGLLFDLLESGPIGPWALVLTLIGFLAGSLQRNIFAESWRLPVTIVLIASFLAQVLYGIVLVLVGSDIGFWASFLHRMLPATLYNAVVSLVLMPIATNALARSSQPITISRRF